MAGGTSGGHHLVIPYLPPGIMAYIFHIRKNMSYVSYIEKLRKASLFWEEWGMVYYKSYDTIKGILDTSMETFILRSDHFYVGVGEGDIDPAFANYEEYSIVKVRKALGFVKCRAGIDQLKAVTFNDGRVYEEFNLGTVGRYPRAFWRFEMNFQFRVAVKRRLRQQTIPELIQPKKRRGK